MTEASLLKKLRRAVKRESTQNAYADKHDIDRGWLSLVLRGRRGISPQVARSMGYEAVKGYRKIREENGE